MNYRKDTMEMRQAFDAMEWGESRQFPLGDTLYDSVPKHLVDPTGLVTKELFDLGPLDFPAEAPYVVFIPHICYPRYHEALDSVKAHWPLTIIIDDSQNGVVQQGNYHVVRPRGRLCFAALQNWMFLFCQKHKIPNMIFMHDDAKFTRGDFIETLLEWGPQTNADIIYTLVDTVSWWNPHSVLFNNEDFPFYYGDIDLRRRMLLLDRPLLTHTELAKDVTHYTNGTTKTMGNNFRQEETDRVRQAFIKKWGGNNGEERFLLPYNAGFEERKGILGVSAKVAYTRE